MRRRYIQTIILLVLVALPFLIYLFLRFGTKPVFDRVPFAYRVEASGDSSIVTLPNFAYSDFIEGQNFTQEDFKGKILLISAFSLKDTLPTIVLTGHLQKIYDNIEWDRWDDIRLISLNWGDGQKDLKGWYRDVKAEPQRWRVLLPDSSEALTFCQQLNFPGMADLSADTKPFTPRVVALVDKEGRVRKYYEGTDLGAVRKIYEDLINLLKLEYPDDLGKKYPEK